MSVLIWFEGGESKPSRGTWRQRLVLRWGRYLACRHPGVEAASSAMLHPEARIHPRGGRMRFGERCIVAAGAVVQGNIVFGDHCSVQTGSILVANGGESPEAGRIRIGNHVRIAPGCMLIASDHVFDDPERTIHGQGMRHADIVIEDDVWVAGRVQIMAGVTIGRGCVIAAGAVVTRDVPPCSVVGGVPAKVIKRRGGEATTRVERSLAVDAPAPELPGPSGGLAAVQDQGCVAPAGSGLRTS